MHDKRLVKIKKLKYNMMSKPCDLRHCFIFSYSLDSIPTNNNNLHQRFGNSFFLNPPTRTHKKTKQKRGFNLLELLNYWPLEEQSQY